jgi:hypothetical protein
MDQPLGFAVLLVSVAAKLGTSFAGPGGQKSRELMAADEGQAERHYKNVWRGGIAVVMLGGRKPAGGGD